MPSAAGHQSQAKKTRRRRRRRWGGGRPELPACLAQLEKCFLSNAEREHGQGEQSDDAGPARPTRSGDSLGDLMRDNLGYLVLLRSAKKTSLPALTARPCLAVMLCSAGVLCYCKLYFMDACDPSRKPCLSNVHSRLLNGHESINRTHI